MRRAAGEDVKEVDGIFEVTCEVESFAAVRTALEEKKIKTQTAEITKIPGTTITIDAKTGEKVLRMIDAFEDHDDVQNVHANFDMPDEVMAQLGG